MKTLYVLRHAKSDWGDSSLRDFDRPLNDRGRKAANAIGKELRRRKVKPDSVLASDAVRAQQTLNHVQEGLGRPLDITNDRRIYMAEPETLLDLLRNAPDDADRLMIVGHNPGLQELVLMLSQRSELRDEAEEKFPTGALAEIRFDRKSWRNIAPAEGMIEYLLRPRDL